MGIAEKKLNPRERRDIALALLPEAKDQAGNGRLQVLCPFHADSNPSFYYCYDEDWYRCYGCEERGDLCKLFTKLRGLDEKEGFVEFARLYLGGLEKRGRRSGHAPPPAPKPRPGAPHYTPGAPPLPSETWQARAGRFTDWAHEQLFRPDNARALEYLRGRGLSEATIRAYRLGYNPKDYFRPRHAWGLPREHKPDGRPRMLRLAMGLVIPWIDGDKTLRLKIRQPDAVLRQDPGQAKYLQVPGGCQRTWIIRPQRRVVVLVETEFDAMLVIQAAGDLVGAVPLGSASARPTSDVVKRFREAALLVNALDSDEAGGKNAWKWWAEQFPLNHLRCPVPEGKDVGDYVAAGHDLRTWVLACLPPMLREVLTAPECRTAGRQDAEAAPVPPDTEAAPVRSDAETAPAPVRPRTIEEAEDRIRREIASPIREQALELLLLLRATPDIHAVAFPEGGFGLRFPPGWDGRNPNKLARASRLIFGEAGAIYARYVDLPVKPYDWWPRRGG